MDKKSINIIFHVLYATAIILEDYINALSCLFQMKYKTHLYIKSFHVT